MAKVHHALNGGHLPISSEFPFAENCEIQGAGGVPSGGKVAKYPLGVMLGLEVLQMKYVLGLIVAAIISPPVNAEEALHADHYGACLIGMVLLDGTFDYSGDVDSASINGCEAVGRTIPGSNRPIVFAYVDVVLKEIYETREMVEHLEFEYRNCRT